MILVLGAGGLLGSHLCASFPDEIVGYTRSELDITNLVAFREILQYRQYHTVINCAGVTPHSEDKQWMYAVNAVAPNDLCQICYDEDVRFIQVSTDCVFSGEEGRYDEEYDLEYPRGWRDSDYALSKQTGEVTDYPNALTVRSSFVGWPDPKNRGLLAWFYRQTDPVVGYTNWVWNGVTTLALAKHLRYFAYARSTGVRHVFGQEVTKYDLLETVNVVYEWDKELRPGRSPYSINRTLTTVYPSYRIPGTSNFREMVEEMKSWESRLSSR